MCRIDAPFGDHPLDENPEPTQRFSQALDEYGVEGNFRSLLIKHFSENWGREFSSIEELEKARVCESYSEKCAAFLSATPLIESLKFDLLTHLRGVPSESRRRYPSLFNFATDVARNYFPESPYSFYKALFDTETLNLYHSFVSVFYGEEYCFSAAFFDDKALTSLEHNQRSQILWGIFNAMTWVSDTPQNSSNNLRDPRTYNLISAVSLSFLPDPPTLGAHWFLKAIDFLKAWVKCDAEAGRLSSIREYLFKQIDRELKGLIEPFGNASETMQKWLQNIKQELEKLSLIHANLTNASEEEIESWARNLDYFILPCSNDNFDLATATDDEFFARERENFVEIYSQLTLLHINAWIQYAVKQDFNSALSSKNDCRLNVLEHSGKWWNTEHCGIWKEEFWEAFSGLDIEGRLRILSGYLNTKSFGWTEQSRREFYDWWNGLLIDLIKNDDFPKQLIPRWTLVAKSRFDSEFVIPFIDKSIGLLRGELSKDGKPEHHKQLSELLRALDFSQPSKALSHRLLLMRSSKRPFSDESLSRFSSMDEENAIEWFRPMKELANSRGDSRVHAAGDDWQQAKAECLADFSRELAEFCLGRLHLRKGEKATDGKYDVSQVVERSAIWRQGYLKALSELGLNLKGDVHRTVNFTKQYDPDEDVRAIAKECYRAVRRDSNKNRSIEDMKRGIVAAEWWLLMCQRRELNLTVNHEEALKTRRRLLRNP